MKTVKSLLLGTAAGFVALTGAHAADLPLAEPVEYVKICDTYGKGYFYIPGTDTCLKISGYVRVEARIDVNDQLSDSVITDPDDFAGWEEDRSLGWFSRGDIRFDARSETEWGTLRSYMEIRANRSPADVDDSSSTELYLGFIQFAGFTIGRASSFYDFLPYDVYGDFFSDTQLETVAYTASFGSGFAATIAVEDKANRATLLYEETQTQAWPNIVAALRVDQAWGSAQVSVAVQDNQGNEVDDVVDDIGWAVNAGLSYNLPFANEGSLVWVQGSYGEGAIDYVLQGRGESGAFTGQQGDYLDDMSDTTFAGENNELWAVGAGVSIAATETVTLNAGGIYYEYDDADGADQDFEGFKVIGNVFWTPVENLHLGVEAAYASVDFDDGVVSDTLDDVSVTVRAQRSF